MNFELGRYEQTLYESIKQYRNLITEQEEEIKKREIIKDSLTSSLVANVKAVVIPYTDKMLQEASRQQGNKKKSEREMYEFVTQDLMNNLFGESEEVKVDKIICRGYDRNSYGFYFDYKGISFELRVPNVANAYKDNLREMWYGEYQLYYAVHSSYWKCVGHSYKLEEIAKAIQDFVRGEKCVD